MVDLTEEDWVIISGKLSSKSASKGEVLTPKGKNADKLYFLLNGVSRLYHETENKEVTLNFAFPESFFCSYSSFLTQEPSEFILEALTPCEMIYLTRKDLDDLYAITKCGHELGRILTEKMFLYLSKRENDLLLKSPTQRYLDLFDEQPHLVQKIPQKYLSSYIGITPQALSRIRAKLAEAD